MSDLRGTSTAANGAAFFDLDKTIIAKSSTFAFSREFQSGGLMTRVAMLRSAYSQLLFTLGGADHDRMEEMRRMTSELVTGWDVATVSEIVAETLHTIVEPMVFAEARELIDEHHAAGRDVIIVSASGFELVDPIGRLLGADHVIATRMGIEDGHYTGVIDFYAYGPAKAEAIRELAEREGYDLATSFGYSDSITDVPLLEAVGRPFAVNPDRELRRIARDREWPVLVFARPTPLFPTVNIPTPAPRTTALVTLGAAAALLAVWLLRRRRRRGTV